MKLTTKKDFTLLRHCLVIKKNLLQYNSEDNQANQINNYQNLLNLIDSGDTTGLLSAIANPDESVEFNKFCAHIKQSSSQKIAKEYIESTKQLLLDNGKYSEQKFRELIKAFCKNTGVDDKPFYELVISEEAKSPYFNETINQLLNDMRVLLKKYSPLTISISSFRELSKEFSRISKEIAKNKFQECFEKELLDIEITSIVNEEQIPLFCTKLIFSNEEKNIIEPIFKTTYYHLLCSSFLEPSNVSKLDNELLKPELIANHLYTYNDSYKKLTQIVNCKFNITDQNTIVYSSISNILPDQLKLELDEEL